MRSVNKILLGFFLFGASIVSVAWAGQPSWVSGDSSSYPHEKYLVGRGVGSTAAEAQDRARGDLATIFEVRIEVANESNITVTQSGKKEQVNKTATQQVSAKTEKVISGIKIAEIWTDPTTQDVHAFAVLERAKAITSLKEELTKIDEELLQLTQTAKDEQDALLKVAALSQALQAAIKRDGFEASIRVLDRAGRGVPGPISQATLQQQIGEALRKVRITSAVEEGTKEFNAVVKGGLAAAGFLAKRMDDAEFVLSGSVQLVDLGRLQGWNWVRATLSVTLVEKESGTVRGRKTWPVKASAQDPATARSRAMIEIEKLFKQELRATIIDFAVNPEGSN